MWVMIIYQIRVSLVTDVGTERRMARDAEETRRLARAACKAPGRKNVL